MLLSFELTTTLAASFLLALGIAALLVVGMVDEIVVVRAFEVLAGISATCRWGGSLRRVAGDEIIKPYALKCS